MTPLDKETLLLFFNVDQPFEFMGSSRYSTLVAALRDCRVYTKRDVNTGNFNPAIGHGDAGNWLGAIGYFTILDQLGSCYKPISEPEPAVNTNSIKFVIEKFGYDIIENDGRQLNALIALRNAFTHDFNLLNIPRDSRLIPLQQHKFNVTADTAGKWIVKLASRHWDGNIDGKDFFDTTDSTSINLFGFGCLTEQIYSSITTLIQKDQIELRVPLLRLINKYTFVRSDHPIN